MTFLLIQTCCSLHYMILIKAKHHYCVMSFRVRLLIITRIQNIKNQQKIPGKTLSYILLWCRLYHLIKCCGRIAYNKSPSKLLDREEFIFDLNRCKTIRHFILACEYYSTRHKRPDVLSKTHWSPIKCLVKNCL